MFVSCLGCEIGHRPYHQRPVRDAHHPCTHLAYWATRAPCWVVAAFLLLQTPGKSQSGIDMLRKILNTFSLFFFPRSFVFFSFNFGTFQRHFAPRLSEAQFPKLFVWKIRDSDALQRGEHFSHFDDSLSYFFIFRNFLFVHFYL